MKAGRQEAGRQEGSESRKAGKQVSATGAGAGSALVFEHWANGSLTDHSLLAFAGPSDLV